MTDFLLPELGEGITSGEVLRVLVKPGDTLAKDQPVVELETDKATVEVPSSVAGHVRDVKVKVGDTVNVGQIILSVDEAGAQAATPKPVAEPAPQPAAKAAEEAPAPSEEPRGASGAPRAPDNVVDINRGVRATAEPAGVSETAPAPAAPSVRRMARELGVDINEVPGSGPDGRISVDDVKAYAKQLVAGATKSGVAKRGGTAVEALPDFSRWGPIERQPMRGVRRKTAAHLSAAWATIPHVTQHDLADITGLEEMRKRYSKQVEAAGGTLTITAIAVKIVAAALKVFPQFNASIDPASNDIILKKYVNIGVAVDTDRGLLVPVIRNADTKHIMQLSVELARLADKARTHTIALDEMQGGCFTITNLGGIGGTAFTPIVNAPEVAILGISRASMQPVFKRPPSATIEDDPAAFVPRLMLPLSLSYDHRVVDGADGIRFLRWVAEALEQPFLLELQG